MYLCMKIVAPRNKQVDVNIVLLKACHENIDNTRSLLKNINILQLC